jgi:sugar lactone lactonase YvrE
MHHFSTTQARRLVACFALATACTGPLPAENPKTKLDEPVKPIDVQVDATRAEPTKAEPEAAKAASPPVFKDVGLKTPESVMYEPVSDVYLVSNINGTPVDKDNNGFISQLNPDGTVKNLKFIAGGANGVTLDAPKGLVVVGDTLYVADIQDVRKFDLATGAPKGSVHFPKASFLNDVASDAKGAIFVTDSGRKLGKAGLEPNGGDTVYKLEGDKVRPLIKGGHMKGPNGVILDGDAVLVSQMGGNELQRFDATGKLVAHAAMPTGGLDGVVQMNDGTWLVSSWEGQSVYRGNFDTAFVAVASGVESPADIGFDTKRGLILIPSFLKDAVHTVALPANTAAPAAVEPKAAAPSTSVAAPPAAAAPSPAAAPTAAPSPATPSPAAPPTPASAAPKKKTP